ncbi:uncharacterized protein BO80DRAFT_187958 [Aspergillus ibericus CBS 121593]|uniref:Uncharacterized protein n=1 Tax=Aspergillus ibericus CBS 121593 TaxID=1448316 RepID=A0A395GQ19_9EURO|nr:hypothetical protein BO80DRAFT_187958 [Aspergillus ibericus CBS 121593]RAK97611.1 hypothetical protein BO80DRAFT_187958 [Aspergillus ibericus CBS 121593]
MGVLGFRGPCETTKLCQKSRGGTGIAESEENGREAKERAQNGKRNLDGRRCGSAATGIGRFSPRVIAGRRLRGPRLARACLRDECLIFTASILIGTHLVDSLPSDRGSSSSYSVRRTRKEHRVCLGRGCPGQLTNLGPTMQPPSLCDSACMTALQAHPRRKHSIHFHDCSIHP